MHLHLYPAKRRDILEICNHIIPYTNSVWKKTVLVSRSFTIYFVKVILLVILYMDLQSAGSFSLR